MSAQAPGLVFIISAPSGAGKTSLVAAVREQLGDLELSVSHTTREPRKGEVHGEHYHFVSRCEFEAEIEAGSMLEHAVVFGNLYGTSANFVEQLTQDGADVVLEIDWQGAEQARNKLVDQVSIMILPPSLAELENRLRSRGKDSEEVILKRLRSAREEMSQAPNFDYIVVNQDFQIAARELVSIITAERTRTARALQRMRGVVTSLIGD